MKPVDQKIYLASKSPRRRELLRQIGVDFELLTLRSLPPRGPDVSENVISGELPDKYVIRITQEKAACAWQMLQARKQPLRPVLTADTTVALGQRILGKPGSVEEAAEMLSALSGRTHEVLTCVGIQYQQNFLQVLQVSEVRFATLPDDLIRSYCATQEPYDKAGGYGIQGLAAMFVEHIVGSHSGIMGLPLFETALLLKQAGIRIL